LCVWTGDDLAAVYAIPYFVRDVSSLEYLKVTYGAAPSTPDDPLTVGQYSGLCRPC
jgi:hypothetical protein